MNWAGLLLIFSNPHISSEQGTCVFRDSDTLFSCCLCELQCLLLKRLSFQRRGPKVVTIRNLQEKNQIILQCWFLILLLKLKQMNMTNIDKCHFEEFSLSLLKVSARFCCSLSVTHIWGGRPAIYTWWLYLIHNCSLVKTYYSCRQSIQKEVNIISVLIKHNLSKWHDYLNPWSLSILDDIYFRNAWHLFFFFNLFLAVLGLRFCAWAFSSCGKRGLLFVAVRGLLIMVASLVAEHRL